MPAGFQKNSLRLTVWDDGDPVGAALQTPPYPLVCNGIPVIVSGRVTTAWRESIWIWMACAVGVTAMAFADAWRSVTGHAGTVTTEERLYRLGDVASAGRGLRCAPRCHRRRPCSARRVGGALLRRDFEPSGRSSRRGVRVGAPAWPTRHPTRSISGSASSRSSIRFASTSRLTADRYCSSVRELCRETGVS